MADKEQKKQQQAKGGAAAGKGDKKPRQQASAAEPEAGDGKPQRPRASNKETARLRTRFEQEVAPALMKELNLTNRMAVPRVNKVVVNMGVGEATQNAKILDPAANEVAQITGQKPVITRARKSIAAFKLREGMPIGVMVTLRGDRMYEFLDRLMNVAL